ncbi:MAG: archaeal heat shock protein Hsp20 [Thermoplasmatota archaeon]
MSNDPFANFPGGNPFGGKNPFDGGPFDNMDDWLRSMGVDPKEFRDLFEDMQRNLSEAFKNMGQDPSKGFMAGFNVKMGPDGKPRFDTFGNKPKVNTDARVPTIKDDGREPLTDVIEDPKSIAITMEVPGVDKKDLDVNMTEDHLEVSVDNEMRKYHKRVKLPAKVDPATTKATYSNGILDVVVQKVEQSNQGVKISVE